LLSDGMAELIKVVAMFDKECFYLLKKINIKTIKNEKKLLYDLVRKSASIKIHTIKQDVSDNNIRQVLNFGHTIGHAIESVEAFNISHGKGVAMGLVLEIQLAIEKGLTNENVEFEMKEVLEVNI
jgi:3-dehydroquinate synthase